MKKERGGRGRGRACALLFPYGAFFKILKFFLIVSHPSWTFSALSLSLLHPSLPLYLFLFLSLRLSPYSISLSQSICLSTSVSLPETLSFSLALTISPYPLTHSILLSLSISLTPYLSPSQYIGLSPSLRQFSPASLSLTISLPHFFHLLPFFFSLSLSFPSHSKQ